MLQIRNLTDLDAVPEISDLSETPDPAPEPTPSPQPKLRVAHHRAARRRP